MIINYVKKLECFYICSTPATTWRISSGFWQSFYLFINLGHLESMLGMQEGVSRCSLSFWIRVVG